MKAKTRSLSSTSTQGRHWPIQLRRLWQLNHTGRDHISPEFDTRNIYTNCTRLWVTDPMSPSSSGPPTPSHSAAHVPPPPSISHAAASSPPASPLPPPLTPTAQPSQYIAPHHPAPPLAFAPTSSGSHSISGVSVPPPLTHSIPASALDGARLSGRLVGVVSLTDILNLHARASGLSPADPAESRSRRRRSSSSSLSVRRSGDIGRELFSRGGM